MPVKNIESLRVGSLIFTTGIYSPLSILIRNILDFQYSHVGLYLGNNELIESDLGGVQISPLSKYIDNSWYETEIVNTSLMSSETPLVISAAMSKKKEYYDYTLVLGSLFARIIHRSRKYQGLLNLEKAWTCSELVSFALTAGGERFKIPCSEITPKDIYLHYKAKRCCGNC